MEGRTALAEGTIIEDGKDTFRILSKISQGGSALIYRALKIDRDGETQKVILKEIYPSLENGFFIRTKGGRIVPGIFDEEGDPAPAGPDSQWFSQGEKLLEQMYLQMEKEEIFGRKLKNHSFLVCNLKMLKEPRLSGEKEPLRGMAEMADMSSSGVVLERYIRSLDDHYDQNIPVGESLYIVRQAAETMEKIHEAGYLYCDLNLGNIFLLNGSRTAVFIDFASVLEKGEDGVETDAYIPSTYGFRAPEVASRRYGKYERRGPRPSSDPAGKEARGGRRIRECSDVYSLAALLRRLVSGEFLPPKDEFSVARFADERMLSWERMKKIGIRNPAAGLVLNQILLDGLQWRQEDRIPGISAFLEQLGRLEILLEKDRDLYESMSLIFRWKSGNGSRLLEGFLETAVPDFSSLELAVRTMKTELYSGSDTAKFAYIYRWLRIWLEKKTAWNVRGGLSWNRQRTEIQLKSCGMTIFNRLGNYQEAVKLYKDCEEMRDRMALSAYLDVRLRGAECYANILDFRSALDIVKLNVQILEMRRSCYEEMAGRLGIRSPAAVRTAELCNNFSAAGRYCAFMGTDQKSIKFRQAMQYFKEAMEECGENEQDRMRIRNSILQLAVSKRDRELFDEYRNLCVGEETAGAQALRCLKAPVGQNRYHLYALLKGIRFFQIPVPEEEFWQALRGLAARAEEPGTAVVGHPWELIFRHAAVLLAEKEGAVTEEARRLFFLSRQMITPLDGIHDARVGSGAPFDMALTLHMVTLAQEYEVSARLETDAEKKKFFREQLSACLENLFCYLKKNRCRILSAGSWKKCRTAEEKYRLVMEKFTFEYT